MKRFWFTNLAIALVMLAAFGLAEWLRIPLLTDPGPYLEGAGAGPALVGLALLLADVLLPVPSSLIMIAFGTVYGVWIGTALGLLGGLGAACVGFACGRAGSHRMERLIGAGEYQRADALLRKHGALAVLVTRPLPLLAETTAIVAGTSGLGWRRFGVAALMGTAPAAALYAAAGATARGLNNGMLISAFVFGLAAVYWLVARKLETRLVRRASDEHADR